jgi:hypothetical protein
MNHHILVGLVLITSTFFLSLHLPMLGVMLAVIMAVGLKYRWFEA